MNEPTEDGSLPSDPDGLGPALPGAPAPPLGPPPPARRHRRLWWVLGPALVLALAGLIAGLFLPIPYYALSPGQVRDAGASVGVDGSSYPADEDEISFVTVSLSQVTPLGALAGWLDPYTDVKPEDEVLVGGDREENREVNQRLMDDSQVAAEVAAYSALGCDVLSGTGALILGIEPGSAAEGVLEADDVVVAVDGEPVEVSADLGEAVDEAGPGGTLSLTVEDAEGATREVEATVGTSPDDPDQALLGVALDTRDLEVDLPTEVVIDAGDVGGPSAGLAFTLALLDELTPGSLTGGSAVTATGTMDARGRVGPVGGVRQKTSAVRQAGSELFLVPPDELAEATDAAGDDLEVVAVSTLEEALDALGEHGGDVAGLDEVDVCEAPAG